MEIGVYLAIHVGCQRVTFIGWDVTSDYSHFWDSRQKTGLSVSPETFIPLTAGGAYGASARDLLDEFALVREESRYRPEKAFGIVDSTAAAMSSSSFSRHNR
jgi:hypothetical protein